MCSVVRTGSPDHCTRLNPKVGLQKAKGKQVGKFVQYLRPTFFIDSDADAVAEKAAALTGTLKDERARAVRMFTFVRDEIKYNLFTPRTAPEDFRASVVLSRGAGYCVQKAVLFTALNRAAGIPARLRFAEIRNHRTSSELLNKRGSNVFVYNGLAEVLLSGNWIKAAPTYDAAYCLKNGFSMVDFDGTQDALLPSQTPDGDPHIDYLKDRGSYEDLPFDTLRAASLSSRYMKIR